MLITLLYALIYNLDHKKINDEKKQHLATYFVAQATLLRVNAAVKDDEIPPIE